MDACLADCIRSAAPVHRRGSAERAANSSLRAALPITGRKRGPARPQWIACGMNAQRPPLVADTGSREAQRHGHGTGPNPNWRDSVESSQSRKRLDATRRRHYP